MNICIIHRYPQELVESVESSFNLTINGLRTNGHTVHIITMFNFDRRKNRLLQSISFVLKLPFILSRLKNKHKIDLIYFADPFPAMFWRFYKPILKTHTILYIGDLFAGYLEFNKGMKSISKFLMKVEIWMYKSINKIITLTESFKDFLEDHGFDNVSVIYDHVDTKMFSPDIERNKTSKKKFVVIVHGFMAYHKGYHVAIEAMDYVVKEKDNITLLVVGDGPEIKNLKNFVKCLSLNEHIIFTGMVPYKEVPRFLAMADIGVIPRLRCQANELVVSQAALQNLAMGNPLIVSELRGMRELIMLNPNPIGVSFKPGDARDLATKILFLSNNRELVNNMSENARKLALKLDNKIAAEQFVKELTSIEKNPIYDSSTD